MLRKTVCSGDISEVNLIVGWNELAKSTKIKIFSIGMFHLLQMNGLRGLANTSHFSRSAKKITEKVTAILVPIDDWCANGCFLTDFSPHVKFWYTWLFKANCESFG